MANYFPEADRIDPPASRPRPLRTALFVALIAFVVGALLMGWALTRYGPARALIGLDRVPPAFTTAPAVPVATVSPLAPPLGPPAAAPPPAASPLVDTRVSELEARIARADLRAAAAAANAGRAEGLLIAFAARRAIDRGTGLGYIEGLLRERFGASQPRAVAQVIAAAQRPVTLARLRQELDAIAPRLTNAVTDADWWTATRRTLGTLVIVRREGAPPTTPDDRLVRARLLIDGGQVDGALAEVSRLPGAASAVGWSTEARRYIEAQQALDILEAAAILPPAPGAVPAAAAN